MTPSPVEHPQTPPADTTSAGQIDQIAQEILDTGVRWWVVVDDYDGRAVRFAAEMEKLGPDDAARLLQVLLEKDGGALASWMTLPIMSRLHDSGLISGEQFAAISNAFASAYNEGKFSDAQMRQFLQVFSLQNVSPGNAADQFGQLRTFLQAGGNSPAMQTFRENFAASLLKDAIGENWAGNQPGLALQICADSGDPDMAARVFATVVEGAASDPVARAAIMDKLLHAVGEASIGYENSRPMGATNPLETLINSVARQSATYQWNEISVAIARYAGSANDTNDVFYDPYSHKPVEGISQALTNLIAGPQGNAVFTELSRWETNPIGGKSGHAQQYGLNAIQLGGLLRLTAFNPDNPQADQALDAVQQWAQMRKDFLNGVQRDDYPPGMDVSQARQDLAMLGGAAIDAVSQMKIDQDNRAAATKQLVSFVVDLALSAVPGGGTISSLVSKDLKAAFGDNARINGLIDQALKSGDKLTSAQIQQLKDGIADVVDGEAGDLDTLKATVGSFVQAAVLTGLPRGTQDDPGNDSYTDVLQGTQVVQTEVDDVRGD
ncbi:hypothetical protein [Luteimonas lutimaris]